MGKQIYSSLTVSLWSRGDDSNILSTIFIDSPAFVQPGFQSIKILRRYWIVLIQGNNMVYTF